MRACWLGATTSENCRAALPARSPRGRDRSPATDTLAGRPPRWMLFLRADSSGEQGDEEEGLASGETPVHADSFTRHLAAQWQRVSSVEKDG